METGQGFLGDNDWVPPRSWTAWPLPLHAVPADDFMKRTENDEDETFTFRQRTTEMPSGPLEEEVSAVILRLAKERFMKRRFGESQPALWKSVEVDQEVMDVGSPASSNASSAAHSRDTDGDQRMSLDEPGVPAGSESRDDATAYTPVVSAADDVSFALLRPSTRAILEKLDQTLTVLPDSRVAGVSHLSDSSATDTPGWDSDGSSPGRKSRDSSQEPRKRGRPRSRTAMPAARRTASTENSSQRRAGGRPVPAVRGHRQGQPCS